MIGSLICCDTSKLTKHGFKIRERENGSRFYIWNSNHVYDGHIDIVVDEYKDHKTGKYRFYKLNKTEILPKLIELANAGLCTNYSLTEKERV